MKHLYCFGLALLLTATLEAQQAPFNKFEIGMDYVMDASTPPYGYTRFTPQSSFPDSAWNRLIQLGITMPQFHITGDYWVGSNLANLIGTAKGKTGSISLADDTLALLASLWERRYYQVEAKEHFGTNQGTTIHQDGYFLDMGNEQRNLPYDLISTQFNNKNANNGVSLNYS